MPAFEYSALDLGGQTRNGTLTAASAAEARALLERRRLLPVKLEPAAASTHAPGRGGRFGGKDLALFTRQLSTLAASAPLEEALRTIGSQSDRRGVRRVVGAGDGQRGPLLPAAVPGDGRRRREFRRPAADPGAPGRAAGTPAAGARQAGRRAGLPGRAGGDRGGGGDRADDLRRAAGGGAVRLAR